MPLYGHIRGTSINTHVRAMSFRPKTEQVTESLPADFESQACLAKIDLISGAQTNTSGVSAGYFDGTALAHDAGPISAHLIHDSELLLF